MSRKILGFRMPELMVVMITLVITVVLLWLNLQNGMKIQRDMNRKADLGEITRGIKFYYQVNNVYPGDTADGQILACGEAQNEPCQWGESWEDEDHIYLDRLPIDTLVESGKNWPNYGYRTNNDDLSKFWLWAFLERDNDPDLITSQEKCLGEWKDNQFVVCELQK